MHAVLTAFLLLASPASAGSPEPLPALRLEAGSLARHQLVAIGRDLIVAGEALEDVAAVDGSDRKSVV